MAKPAGKFKMITCKRCDYKWQPRVSSPTSCPNCRSTYWNKPPESKGKRKFSGPK